jgi:aspartyl-tRNA(Asn)/glutamyl-tRNA(Gln) amidotransferase subunit C
MSVDEATVRRIAKLARIGVEEAELAGLAKELSQILKFVEQLNELDTAGVTPLTSAVETRIKRRVDEVTDGEIVDQVLANAPSRDEEFFAVPKVVE